MGRELFHQTLDLVKCTFCHVLLLPKENVSCITRSTWKLIIPDLTLLFLPFYILLALLVIVIVWKLFLGHTEQAN